MVQRLPPARCVRDQSDSLAPQPYLFCKGLKALSSLKAQLPFLR